MTSSPTPVNRPNALKPIDCRVYHSVTIELSNCLEVNMEHVVIQDPKQTYGDIGNLDVLCRCRATKHPPYDKVNSGDTIFIQHKGGSIVVKYTVSSAISTPYKDVDEIRELCKASPLFGATEYWRAQQGRQYGTVVWLTGHERVSPPIERRVAKGNANDWIILDTKEKRQQWPGL